MRGFIASTVAVLLFIVTPAFAAVSILADIDGTKQGRFKADSPKGIAATKLIYEVKSPRDMATGQASGRRQYGPLCITKEVGASSPQFFQATVTNEVLKSALFRFMRTNPNGEEYVYYSLKLTNATVSNYKQMSGYADPSVTSAKTTSLYDTHNQEEVCFTFQRIEVQSTDGKTMAMDDWMARP